MDEILQNWIELNKTDFELLGRDSNTLHHAAQFLAYAAKVLVPKKDDDSHTIGFWIPNKNMLAGREVETRSGEIRLALEYPEFKLMLTGEDLDELKAMPFSGNTRQGILSWLNHELKTQRLDKANLSAEMHYEIPSHETDSGAQFEILEMSNLKELANYRSNGHMILEYFAGRYPSASEVLVWPHHFDEGVYIPITYEDEVVTQSISLGLAVPDAYYDNPYFYVTAWKKTGLDYEDLPEIIGLRKEAQAETTIHFMENAIQNAMDLLNHRAD